MSGQLKQRTDGLEVRIHDVLKDKTQLLRLYQLSKKSGRPTPVLPAIYVCDHMFFGFDDALLVTVVVATRSYRRLQEREGRWLKLLSGAVILVLGLVMLLRSSWLQLGS